MLHWLRRNAELKRTAAQMYERIVAQARSEPFYRDLGVPDTMEGRFEMIVLHLFLVRERLKHEGHAGQRIGQVLLERLISDMDDALRQIGYDMGVPKRVKRAAGAFAERSAAYAAALGADDQRLGEALRAHVYGTAGTDGPPADRRSIADLAGYVRRAANALAAAESPRLLAGDIAFPPPGGPR